ncbi:MAG: hypothetical protein IJX97_00450 [Clostridia bacterium]|nr:hypothetical protein [Clostridia bacterium]
MTKSAKKTLIYITALITVGLICVIIRTAALFTELDSEAIYFNNDTLITVSSALSVAFALFCISYIFVADKDLSLSASFDNAETYVPSGLVSVALVFMSMDMLGKIVKDYGSVFSKANFSSVPSVLMLLVAVLAPVCIVNFFLNSFLERKENRSRAAFCMSCVAFLSIYAAYLYFSTALPMNAPNKIVDQMAYLALAVFFLYETRISLNRATWRPYIAFGLIAAHLSAYSSIPALIYYFASGVSISESVAESILTLTLSIFVTFRLLLTIKLSPTNLNPTAEAILMMSKNREKEIEDSAKVRSADIYNYNEENKSTDTDDNYKMELFTPETMIPNIDNSDKAEDDSDEENTRH